jgi:hypothetical protein
MGLELYFQLNLRYILAIVIATEQKNAVFVMLRRVTLVRTAVSEERTASIIRVTRIGELGTTLAVTSSPILVTLMMEALRSNETSVLTRAS